MYVALDQKISSVCASRNTPLKRRSYRRITTGQRQKEEEHTPPTCQVHPAIFPTNAALVSPLCHVHIRLITDFTRRMTLFHTRNSTTCCVRISLHSAHVSYQNSTLPSQIHAHAGIRGGHQFNAGRPGLLWNDSPRSPRKAVVELRIHFRFRIQTSVTEHTHTDFHRGSAPPAKHAVCSYPRVSEHLRRTIGAVRIQTDNRRTASVQRFRSC